MPASFKLTQKQNEGLNVLADSAKHNMLFGGSRSGKTFLAVRSIIIRALAAPESRHAILRFRFNHVKSSVVMDTFPKVMKLCFPDISYKIDKTDWYAEFPNKAQIWFGGLDDKERTEKILGQEYVTIYLNECSQIPYSSRNLAVTRLAQAVTTEEGQQLRLKMYYDCNPPSKAHWTYKIFIEKKDPETRKELNEANYTSLLMNPGDNLDNLPKEYVQELEELPERLKKRFLLGQFMDIDDNALWSIEIIEKSKTKETPRLSRVVVAVDPSGADSEDCSNDAIGICVCGLGVDGKGYLLEDLTIKAAPSVWGDVVTSAYERHQADRIVAEGNFGGAMVEHVIQASNPHASFELVNASRGKVVRAEPISALHEKDKIRLVGDYPELEDELLNFMTTGYIGPSSPNRADAFIWGMSELFPGVVQPMKNSKPIKLDHSYVV